MNFTLRYISQILILVFSQECIWAQLPQTHIYSLDLEANESKVMVDNVQLLTNFNAQGYNNQPHFIDSESLLITSNWKNEAKTDIWLLNLKSIEINRITATKAGEFSPTIESNGMDFSVIRQTMANDNSPIQVLWSYPLDRSNGGKPIILDPATIGYHSWLSSELVALFLVGEPNELILYNTKSQSSEHVTYNIGRSLKTTKKGELLFIQKTGTTFHIRKYDPSTQRSTLVTATIDGQEDFDLLPNGFLIAGKGAQLMVHRPLLDHGWTEIMDLSSLGIKNISRIASSNNRVAIVTSAK